MHIAWYSEDRPFAVGYADGKLLIGSKEPLEKGAVVVIDAHKVHRTFRACVLLACRHDSDEISSLQESVTCMKWAPGGQALLTCAREETVNVWVSAGPQGPWSCLQALTHPSVVNAIAWCPLPGRSPKALGMLAT